MPGVLVEERLAGCIKWLPRKEDLVQTDWEIEAGCLNHPVVTLSSQARNGRVEILIITSFGGLDLETKYPSQLSARRDHLPIAPSKAHPDNGTQLVLQDSSSELRKKSYVKTRNRHSVLLASLQPYNRRGPEIYLSKRSYRTLVEYIQYSEPQDAPSFYASVYVREHDFERAIGVQRIGADRIRSDTVRTSSSIVAASRAERQPLLPPPDVYRPRRYGSYTPLPTTHPILAEYRHGSPKSFDSKKFWKCVKVILWILLALSVSYGLYRGGCWTIAACRRAVEWIKEGLGSIGEKARNLWSKILQAVGLGKTGVVGVSGTAGRIWEFVASNM
ncbi:hypothetical protein F5B17DRAFT_83502 [Nemania serpens]|nr:hypothetical protein F5B17DRAFT_83502 [Nemania serpens]